MFFTDTTQFFLSASAYLTRYPSENNLQLGISKSMMDSPSRYPLHERLLMIVKDSNTNIQMVAIWTPPHFMTLSFQIITEQSTELRHAILKGLTNILFTQDFTSLRIENSSKDLSFDDLEGIIRKLGRKLTGVLSDEEECLVLCKEYVNLFKDSSKAPTYQVTDRMISYALSRDNLVLPKTETEYEVKILDTSNSELVKIYTGMIQKFWKYCFPNRDQLSEEFILENILMKPSQSEYSFYITRKGDSKVLATTIATPIPKACRYSYVWTEEEYRGKGIASFMIQSISKHLFEKKDSLSGELMFDKIFLFADATNPTSNGVYVRSGFKPERELAECALNYHE
ncbi:GCN5-related N-acetyltransferase [Naegleria gruberi]|uniref:GCN5-related N-acetyltransferase n=1 Tax=Naegleria gruberi TaxID=5762 RepID=D2V0S0_NAEGR|nr:GCN5-related N-acetyltransferase [Naegleria gruberi]EFC49777.1 GCN5-related N-acetyltransferase [Naegleria gruberi]|eukprot:XP_002682521.1 GCN5-related N-acetyltransferase [Naegleria gruberi strain NEG-M]